MERHALAIYYHRILHSNYIYMNFITELEVHVSLSLTGLGINFMLATEPSVCMNETGVRHRLTITSCWYKAYRRWPR